MRSQHGSIFTLKHHNFFLLGAMLASLVLTTSVIYIPFLANAFEFEAISLAEYAVAMGLALLVIPIVECIKFIRRKMLKKA